MTGRRQEAALRLVGPLGGVLLAGQFERRGADAFFQVIVAGRQFAGHVRHFADLTADQPGADEQHDSDQQAERG